MMGITNRNNADNNRNNSTHNNQVQSKRKKGLNNAN